MSFVLKAACARNVNTLQASQAPFDNILLRKPSSSPLSQDTKLFASCSGLENELEGNERITNETNKQNSCFEAILQSPK